MRIRLSSLSERKEEERARDHSPPPTASVPPSTVSPFSPPSIIQLYHPQLIHRDPLIKKRVRESLNSMKM